MRAKILIGGAAMLAWGLLVILKMTDAAPFVDALKTILTTIGVYHVINQGK